MILIREYFSEELKRILKIRISYPKNFKENQQYPVIFMHDGQGLFTENNFGKSWKIQETLEIKNKEVFVIGIDSEVGIGGGNRFQEYSAWDSEIFSKYIFGRGVKDKILKSKGKLYFDYFKNTLLPSLEVELPLDKNNYYMAGSSMGALITLYFAGQSEDLFKGIGVFSPALWYEEEKILKYLNENFDYKGKIFMTIGTEETSNSDISEFPQIYLKGAEKINELISKKKLDINYKIYKDHKHEEEAWRIQSYDFIDFLF